MDNDFVLIRLERLAKKISTLEGTLLTTSNMLEDKDNKDSVYYAKENIEGVAEFLNDIRNDVDLLCEQINKKETGLDLENPF